jgi:hypothetical protein
MKKIQKNFSFVSGLACIINAGFEYIMHWGDVDNAIGTTYQI